MSKVKLASSVILSRGQGFDTEVYLCLRAPELKFFGGYWVFPGGNLDNNLDVFSSDESVDIALHRCAVRELLEEVHVLSSTLGENFPDIRKTELKNWIETAPDKWRDFISQRNSEFPQIESVFRITTPPFIPVRFDTQFYHVQVAKDESPAVDQHELIDGQFIKAADAVKAWESGNMYIAPPVLFLLRLIARHGVPDFFDEAAKWEIKLE